MHKQHEMEGWSRATMLGIADYLSCTGGGEGGTCPHCATNEKRGRLLKKIMSESAHYATNLRWEKKKYAALAVVAAVALLLIASPVMAGESSWWGKAKVAISGWLGRPTVPIGWGPGVQRDEIANGQVVLSWDHDGDPDLAGFKIYYGVASSYYTESVLVASAAARTAAVTGLDNGTLYYFAATAYDTDGNESGYSNEVSKTP